MSIEATLSAPAAKSRRTKNVNRQGGNGALLPKASEAGVELLAEVVVWDGVARGVTVSRDQVVAALQSQGFDEKYAREFTPSTAFTRAATKMKDNNLINEVGRTDDEIIFQFTRTFLKSVSKREGEMVFKAECKIELNRKTGVILAGNSDIQGLARKEFAKAMEERTNSDITSLIQRLFEDYSAQHPTGTLIPARRAGGVYQVLSEHSPFVDRVEGFLKTLGGSMNRLPVPKGTSNGDSATARNIRDLFKSLMEKHSKAVEGFGVSTRPSTLEESAQEIKESRVKLEAFKSYLGELYSEAGTFLDTMNENLVLKINEITTTRENTPEEQRVGYDRFGARFGTDRAKLHAVITESPSTIREIVERSTLDDKTDVHWPHLPELVAKGLLLKTLSGNRVYYYLPPAE